MSPISSNASSAVSTSAAATPKKIGAGKQFMNQTIGKVTGVIKKIIKLIGECAIPVCCICAALGAATLISAVFVPFNTIFLILIIAGVALLCGSVAAILIREHQKNSAKSAPQAAQQ